MTKVIHGTVHKGMIKPVDMLEENEEVLIIRVKKPKKSTIDMIAEKPREMLNHSFVEEIIESTESGEGIDWSLSFIAWTASAVATLPGAAEPEAFLPAPGEMMA